MQRIFHLALAVCSVLLIASNVSAQQDPSTSPELKQDLQRIGAAATAQLLSMPSFTCDESAVSQALRDHKILRSMALSGIIRTIRKPDGRMAETNDYKHDHILLFIPKVPPLFVSGGFASALAYFLPATQRCFRYTLSPGRIDFEAQTNPAQACAQRGTKGFALLTPDGNVSHIERTIPPDVANPLKLATFAAIDLAPVQLGGTTYPLSHRMVAEMPLHDATGHFEATYTNCHLFTATVTLGPATEVPPDAPAKPQ